MTASSTALPTPTDAPAGRVRRAVRLARTALLAALLVVVVLAVVALVIVPKSTGAVPLTVLTGSMRPTVPPGSMVVVRPVDPARLEIGDVITYQLRPGDPTLVTHRIVGATYGDERTFRTKGDHNSAVDPEPVHEIQVRGRVWYAVPVVGHLANQLDNAQRDWVRNAAGGLLLAWAAWTIGGWLRDRLRHRPGPSDAAMALDTARPWPAPVGPPIRLDPPDSKPARR